MQLKVLCHGSTCTHNWLVKSIIHCTKYYMDTSRTMLFLKNDVVDGCIAASSVYFWSKNGVLQVAARVVKSHTYLYSVPNYCIVHVKICFTLDIILDFWNSSIFMLAATGMTVCKTYSIANTVKQAKQYNWFRACNQNLV